jgi:hypothetical protein
LHLEKAHFTARLLPHDEFTHFARHVEVIRRLFSAWTEREREEKREEKREERRGEREKIDR